MGTDHPFHSPFAHLFGTNHAPDKDEIQKIDSFLHEPQRRLDVLNDRIARVEEKLSKLRAERTSLESYIGEHRALLAPFRRLPTDIIGEIFIRCLDRYPVRSMKHAPLLFTTICRPWRQIALGTPRLWCSIHLFIPANFYGEHQDEQYRDLLKERLTGAERWMERSGSVPMTISLSFSPILLKTAPLLEALRSIIDTVIRYCSQWKELSIRGANPELLAPLGALKPSQIPKLDSLELDTGYAPEIHNIRSLIQAPLLHKLRLMSVQQPLSELSVRWDHITEIHLEFSRPELCPPLDLLKIFAHMHRTVRQCIFSVELPSTPLNYADRLDCPRIHLPLLESMQLTFLKQNIQYGGTRLDASDIRPFMRTLVCPLLENLMIYGRESEPMTEFPLTEFLGQCSDTLKSFETDLVLSTLALKQCLRCIPSITSLSLRHRRPPSLLEDYNEQIHLLASSDSAGSNLLCPLLQTFDLLYPPSSSASAVISVIAARLELHDTENTRRLREVTVRYAGYTGEEYRSKVNEFRKQGLNIKWTFSNNMRRRRVVDPPGGGLPGDLWSRSSTSTVFNQDSY